MSPKLILLLLAAPLLAQNAAIEKAVLEVSTQMTRAAEARDIDRMFSFILPSERGSIAQSGVLFLTREEALAAVTQSFVNVRKMQYKFQRQLVTVISPDCAVLVADGESAATGEDGRNIGAPFTETLVFVRREGEWKVLHAHFSSPPRR